ncbi:putative UPF0481 protein At3g02645 [Pistacia vera]|uniref:putative UPF0481 protein At3g02645 n=1 Tax=Pistacia vera TaxID=55513 RepID=UPI001262F2CE|nr:putative UPF0481 protein At3g02645 [Pistacia vera]
MSGFFKLVNRAKKLVKLEDLVKELRIDIDKNLEPELDAHQCCIYRVHKYLCSVNEEAYTPQLVSIGPFHHGKEELANMEKIKRQYVKSFVERITIDNRDKILNFIKDNDKNIQLLLRDQLDFDVSDLLLSTPTAKASLCLDFQLLENQLPYFVLEKICELALAGLNMHTFMFLSWYFFWPFNDLELSILTPQQQIQYFEVLEMQIPHLKIFDITESLLRNVMALEQCHYPWNTHVCNYVRIMNYLIDTEKDVDLLVGNGIISNYDMGDNASVASMFNKLGLFISVSGSSYYGICEELKRHYNNPGNRRKATLKRVYFNNLWRGTTTVAAVLLLLLTIIQTICSILQVV